MTSLLRCPNCLSPLLRQDTAYRCGQGHCFDRAAAGYVHLLPVNHMHSKSPGDGKGMAAARNRFLSAEYYAPLCQQLAALCLEYAPMASTFLDSGCGEGYYTAALHRALTAAGHTVQMAGIDLSKHSLRWAAKRDPDIEFAVASVYHLPLADQSVDVLLNCFSPLALEEFQRVLKANGIFFYVVPGQKHLWELKQVLYDTPYPNEEKQTPYPGFAYRDIRRVDTKIFLRNQQNIHDLFEMTPYFWKTPQAGTARLSALEQLEVTVSFQIHVFQKDT